MIVHSHLKLFIAAVLSLVFLVAASFGQAIVQPLFVAPPSSAAAAAYRISSPFDPVERLRSRAAGFDVNALKSLIHAAQGNKGELRHAAAPSAGLNLFEDTFVPFFAESIRPTDDQVGQILSGPVGYARDGHAMITVYQGAMAASVRLSNGEFYQVFVPANGYGEVEQCRFRGYLHNETDVLVPDRTGEPVAGDSRLPKDGGLLQYANAADGQSIIDVMIAYTARAREARGGVAGILAHINQVIAETNQGFSNSSVAISFRLVYAVEVSFDDSSSAVDYGIVLPALRDKKDGSMDEVHALRDQYGADLVSLFISPPLPSSGSFTVGMAYLLDNNPAYFASSAFSVVHQAYAGGSSLSFPHEAGHNLGLNHDTANGGANGGLHKSSVGYQQKQSSPTFFTIMAYSSGCGGCTPLNNFSNPRVSYSGIPTGIAGDLGAAGTIDAAATLEEVRFAAANWSTAAAGTCSYSLSGVTTSQGSAGGSLSVNVTAGSGCSWTAQSNASWITVTSGANGSGNGVVKLSVAGNTAASSRTGTVTIASQTFTVQQAAAPCSYSLSGTLGSVGGGGGSLGVNVVTASNCSWTAQSNVPWITVTAGATGSGNGAVALSIAPNTETNSRTGTVTIAGQTFTVQQAVASCSYSLSGTLGSIGDSGGSLGVNVVTTSNCSWTAQSNAGWITITAGATGSGNGTVNLSIARNTTTSARTGTVTIAGKTYTVQQAAPPPVIVCTYSVGVMQFAFGQAAQSSTLQVSTGSTCGWSASSNVSWISVSPSAPALGNGTVTIGVQANTSASPRTATVTVAGQAITITQSGQPSVPVITLSPSQIVLSAVKGSQTSSWSSVLIGSDQPGVAFSIGTGLPAWLGVSASSGVTPASLQISANPTGMEPGTYSAKIPIQSSGTANQDLSLNVTFSVEGDTVIRSSPRSLSFRASSADTGVLSQSIQVKVFGSDTPVRALVQGAAWLSASVGLAANIWVVRVNADPRGLAPGVYDANVGVSCVTASCESVSIPVRLQVTGSAPAAGAGTEGSSIHIASGGIVNAASFQQGITEGSWMSIFGSGFSTETREWSLEDFDGSKFPTVIAGVSVKVNGRTAPIHFVGPGQINFQAPAKIGAGWALVEVETPNGTDRAYTYASRENPGFFQVDAAGQVAALLSDGRALGRLPDDPATGAKWTVARPGDIIAIYGTGFGPTDPAVEPGFIYSGAAALVAKGTLRVSIGGVEAKVEFAGQSGGGLNQINVVVPSLPRGDYEILAIIDGAPTQFAGKLAVD